MQHATVGMVTRCVVAVLMLVVPWRAAAAPVAVDLAPSRVAQGGLFLVTATSDGPLTVEGSVEGASLAFFPSPVLGTWRAIGGVAVDAAPGRRELVVAGKDSAGRPFRRLMGFEVVPGAFLEEKLRVAPAMAEPPDDVRSRIRREAELVRRLTAVRTEPLLTGAFIRPVPGAVTSPFGTFRTFNGTVAGRHLGVDFRGGLGTPIRSSNAGVVVLSQELYYSGNTVLVDHGVGLFTVYAHLQEVAVATGDRVERGDVVGRVGASGRVTGPHLHWGVRLDGRYQAPLEVLDLPLLPAAVVGVDLAAVPGPGGP